MDNRTPVQKAPWYGEEKDYDKKEPGQQFEEIQKAQRIAQQRAVSLTVLRNQNKGTSKNWINSAMRHWMTSGSANFDRTSRLRSRGVIMAAWEILEKKYEQATLALKDNHPQKAVPILRELVGEEPNEPLFHWQLGRALSELREYQQAVHEFQQALQLDPENVPRLGLSRKGVPGATRVAASGASNPEKAGFEGKPSVSGISCRRNDGNGEA